MIEYPTNKLLRAMSWERAKGELQAMLRTYYHEEDKFSQMDKLVSDLIMCVEGEELEA